MRRVPSRRWGSLSANPRGPARDTGRAGKGRSPVKRQTTVIGERRRSAWTGRLFLLPWALGALLFFLLPLGQSLLFSFQNVRLGEGGYTATWAGLEHYLYAFTKDPDYVKSLAGALKDMLYEVPIILVFSLFIAVVLNQPFRGRTVARAILFLPVIVSSGVVISILKGDVFAQNIVKEGGANEAFLFQGTGLQGILVESGLPQSVVDVTMNVVNRIFDTLWKTGVQVLLFLSSLQGVPRSAYEAAQVEGSSAWETFWLITFPLVSPTILVCIVYTIVDSFTSYGNAVLETINREAFSNYQYSYSAAIAWIYFVAVFLIILAVNWLLSKKIFYQAE